MKVRTGIEVTEDELLQITGQGILLNTIKSILDSEKNDAMAVRIIRALLDGEEKGQA